MAPRSGISLTEVLIAMGLLTLGLLGVAAIFPVGGYYMQKATIADNGHGFPFRGRYASRLGRFVVA